MYVIIVINCCEQVAGRRWRQWP